MKCDTAACHRHLKVDQQTRTALKQASAEAGIPAGVLCPACVKKALQEESEYFLDMSAGEIIAESTVAKPRWRMVFRPTGPIPETESAGNTVDENTS